MRTGTSGRPRTGRGVAAALALGCGWLADPASADCLIGISPNTLPPFSTTDTLFPNWLRAPAAAFLLEECDDTVCGIATANITALTIFNYGTASGGPTGDIRGVYWELQCGSKTATGPMTMTYAGNWTVGPQTYPAWTWSGNIAWGDNPCDNPGFSCACFANLLTYVDIAPCPTDGDTVELGPGFNMIGWGPGVMDSAFCGVSGPLSDPAIKTLRYIMKTADKDVAAPGDIINYTIYYGRPGTGTLANLWVMDTLPQYTHYIDLSAVPAPDGGYNPDPGPPVRLRWTFSSLPTAGGPTAAISFQVSVDWGNGDAFEPGSGDFGAPEGAFMFNNAHLSWDPTASCASGRVSNSPAYVVKRFLFWKIGDQDVLFAPRLGQPDDEIIYEIFMKNVSNTKTWWDVRVWDTVPAQIDSWSGGFGFEDPCLGWTMTPSGCAAATPGKFVAGANTLMTWKLDMPPGYTLTIRWKGKVKTSTPVGATVRNTATIEAFGNTGITGGTGPSGQKRQFTHEALVVLRTTFVSYVGWGAEDTAWYKGCTTFTYWISFYPLNKACDFQLYKRWCCPAAPCDVACAPFAAVGGVSPRIDVFAGTCTGGPLADWEPGCKVERAPSRFVPSAYAAGGLPPTPYNYLHKMVSNAPMVWELSTCMAHSGADADAYAGTSSLTFKGFISYTHTQWQASNVNAGNTLHIVNTDDTKPTSIFVFKWNAALLAWDIAAFQDLYNGSEWAFTPAPLTRDHWRVISSDTGIIVHKAYVGIGVGGAYNDMGTHAPNRESGSLVSQTLPATFYLYAGHLPGADDVAIVGNLGAAATYEIWKYTPFDTAAKNPMPSNISADLVSNAGDYTLLATHTVGALNTVLPGAPGANPHVYGANYDASTFVTRYRLYKIKLIAGGPIQTYCGRNIIDNYSGGSMMHARGVPLGSQTGQEYWMHENASAHDCGGTALYSFDVFSPKVNCVINLASSDGYSATYTTTDVDECVAFREISMPASPNLRNWRVQVLPGGNPGNVIAQYIACNAGEKFYTAPFLQRGTFYDIIAPPVVFIGQNFWLTIVVIEADVTKEDYCGTSSFTSTDPGGKIEGTGMDTYNFTWSSSKGSCNVSPNENGVYIFVNVSFTRLGMQTFVASDTTDGTITGLATIMVVGADVRFEKSPRLAVNASNDTVAFRVCWSNYSSASAFTFTITDAVPMGTTFLPEAGTWAFACGSTDNVAVVSSYSTATTPTVPLPASWVTANPVAGTRWLRWTVPMAGVQTTGCACYRVTVN